MYARKRQTYGKRHKNKIEFMVVCISEFARRYKLTLQQAFRYLNNWKGLAFLEEFYDVEHLLSIEDAVDDLTVVCKKTGECWHEIISRF